MTHRVGRVRVGGSVFGDGGEDCRSRQLGVHGSVFRSAGSNWAHWVGVEDDLNVVFCVLVFGGGLWLAVGWLVWR